MRVLIAEDDPTSMALLRSALHRDGYEITVAANGKEAQRHLRKQPFDAVLTDWMMPEMDGIQLIREIRRTCDPVPLIIMITAIGLAAAFPGGRPHLRPFRYSQHLVRGLASG